MKTKVLGKVARTWGRASNTNMHFNRFALILSPKYREGTFKWRTQVLQTTWQPGSAFFDSEQSAPHLLIYRLLYGPYRKHAQGTETDCVCLEKCFLNAWRILDRESEIHHITYIIHEGWMICWFGLFTQDLPCFCYYLCIYPMWGPAIHDTFTWHVLRIEWVANSA